MANLGPRVKRLVRRKGLRCPHCGKFPTDPPSSPAERDRSGCDIDPQAFADFMILAERCRGTSYFKDPNGSREQTGDSVR
jgi:hypothetical protein